MSVSLCHEKMRPAIESVPSEVNGNLMLTTPEQVTDTACGIEGRRVVFAY